MLIVAHWSFLYLTVYIDTIKIVVILILIINLTCLFLILITQCYKIISVIYFLSKTQTYECYKVYCWRCGTFWTKVGPLQRLKESSKLGLFVFELRTCLSSTGPDKAQFSSVCELYAHIPAADHIWSDGCMTENWKNFAYCLFPWVDS